ncbi:MAG: hypothetical protein GX111_11640 [Clostridiales bacterium]|nr:hypothetical protein [Clostridiales bacterium]
MFSRHKLYAGDGEHQNAKSAYLNACVLAKTIFGIDPLKLPSRIETDTLSDIPTEIDIRILRKAAASV